LRAAGRIPAVIYGRQIQPQSLELPLKEFKDVIQSAHSEIVLLDLTVEGDAKPKRLALIQEVQHHVLTQKFLHVDLHEVAENEKVTLMVPVEAVGEAIGVKSSGGILEHVLHKLKVRCLPKDLPESLIVDVSALDVGKSVHLGEIKAAPGVEIIGDKHTTVLHCAAPISEAEEAAATAAATPATAEVEMTKEKKEEGAEGAAPAKAGEKAPAAKGGDKAPAAKGDKAAAGDKKPAEKKK
jgi:large subunit ribosomal protein L25